MVIQCPRSGHLKKLVVFVDGAAVIVAAARRQLATSCAIAAVASSLSLQCNKSFNLGALALQNEPPQRAKPQNETLSSSSSSSAPAIKRLNKAAKARRTDGLRANNSAALNFQKPIHSARLAFVGAAEASRLVFSKSSSLGHC